MMLTLPTSPIGQHNAFIEALCDDWREAGKIAAVTPRADAVREIIKQSTRDGGGDSNPLPTIK